MVYTCYIIYRILDNNRSDSKDYPDEMVEMVLPIGEKNTTFVNPRLGKKIPSGRRDLTSNIRMKRILFRPNIQTLKITAKNGNAVQSNEVVHKDPETRMYNFTQFEDEKSKHHHK